MMKAGELPRSSAVSAFPVFRYGWLPTDHINANEMTSLVLDGNGKLHNATYDSWNPAADSYPGTGVLRK